MKTIYLVMGSVLYGDSEPVRAFVDREAAENFVKGLENKHRWRYCVEEIMLVED